MLVRSHGLRSDDVGYWPGEYVRNGELFENIHRSPIDVRGLLQRAGVDVKASELDAINCGKRFVEEFRNDEDIIPLLFPSLFVYLKANSAEINSLE